jgi:hypothetical protein
VERSPDGRTRPRGDAGRGPCLSQLDGALVVGEAKPAGTVYGAEDTVRLDNHACWCRLIQREKRRRKKASGGPPGFKG